MTNKANSTPCVELLRRLYGNFFHLFSPKTNNYYDVDYFFRIMFHQRGISTMPNEVVFTVYYVKSQILLSKNRHANKRNGIQHPYQLPFTYLWLFLNSCVSKFHVVVFMLSRHS